jgi:hypothetical protein
MYNDILFNYVSSLFLRPKKWYQDADGYIVRNSRRIPILSSIYLQSNGYVLYITKSYYQPYHLLGICSKVVQKIMFMLDLDHLPFQK